MARSGAANFTCERDSFDRVTHFRQFRLPGARSRSASRAGPRWRSFPTPWERRRSTSGSRPVGEFEEGDLGLIGKC